MKSKNETRISIKRTSARHDRGILYLFIGLLAFANVGNLLVTYYLLSRNQVYSVPDIQGYLELKINWGRND
jgi:hypothetical protein